MLKIQIRAAHPWKPLRAQKLSIDSGRRSKKNAREQFMRVCSIQPIYQWIGATVNALVFLAPASTFTSRSRIVCTLAKRVNITHTHTIEEIPYRMMVEQTMWRDWWCLGAGNRQSFRSHSFSFRLWHSFFRTTVVRVAHSYSSTDKKNCIQIWCLAEMYAHTARMHTHIQKGKRKTMRPPHEKHSSSHNFMFYDLLMTAKTK